MQSEDFTTLKQGAPTSWRYSITSIARHLQYSEPSVSNVSSLLLMKAAVGVNLELHLFF